MIVQTLLSWDHRIFWFVNQHHTILCDWFFLLITNLGNGWVVAPVLITLVLWRLPRAQWRAVIICGALALCGSGIASSVIKQQVDRSRPIAQFPAVPDRIHVVGEKLFWRAFPSGHTTTAFAAAVFCGLMFGGRFWFGLVAAGLVGYSRIYMGAHFPLDTVAGAVLGSGFGAGVVMAFIKMRWLKQILSRQSRK